MPTDDTMQLVYYALLLVVIGGALLFELSGRGSKARRQLALWVVIFAGVTLVAKMWDDGGMSRQQVLADGRNRDPGRARRAFPP